MGDRTAQADVFDVVIIGNGTAAAGAVVRLKERFRREPASPLRALVLEAMTEQDRAALMPEYNARVTFPADLPGALPDLGRTVITWYDKVAYYSHGDPVRKTLPPGRVALVDVNGLIDLAERDLPPQIEIRWHKQVCDASYSALPDGSEVIELTVQYPFGPEKVFEETDRIRARVVIDCAGTGSLLLDKMQGYRNDSAIVCGVLAFKVLGAKVPDPHEVSLGLDDSITHGAGSWSYPNAGLSAAMTDYLERWFKTTTNVRLRALVDGRPPAAFAGTICDVGISSIAPYANAQHYQRNLERQADELFQELRGYRDMFPGAAVIPGSAFFKPSPVLQPVGQMAGRRYMLAGDAAGHATPYIGEGVRPGMVMGHAAAGIALDALASGDFSGDTLRRRFEDAWWERFGRYDIWSDLFRNFSSTCFSDTEWDAFFLKLRTLSPDEFYLVLRSEYNVDIVRKMFPYGLVPHYVSYQARSAVDFFRRRLTARQVVSWIR
ncbi:MAG TPA: hypothetical protein VGQ83_35970 [Polyangia bacterium]|jgi:flavin-dependent dehydrogenase